MPVLRRAVGSLSRRMGRPELLATFYPGAREELREEIAIRAILASTLRHDATYVDVGTNRGQLLKEAIRVAPRGRHLVFEPIPALAEELVREFPSVDCREMALGANRESMEFCYFRSLDGWSGLRRNPLISDELGDPEYITIAVSTLDREIGDLLPRVVKIDVEGAELGVIEGARTVLAEVRPLVIFEHVSAAAALYDAAPDALWSLLAELDYELFTVTGDGPVGRRAFAVNDTVVNWLARPGVSPRGAGSEA